MYTCIESVSMSFKSKHMHGETARPPSPPQVCTYTMCYVSHWIRYLINRSSACIYICGVCVIFVYDEENHIVLLEIKWMCQWGNLIDLNLTSKSILQWWNLAELKHLSYRINWPACNHCRSIKFNLNMVFIVPSECANEIQFQIRKKNSIISMDYDYGSE